MPANAVNVYGLDFTPLQTGLGKLSQSYALLHFLISGTGGGQGQVSLHTEKHHPLVTFLSKS